MHTWQEEKESSPELSLAGPSGEDRETENFFKRLQRYGKAHARALDMHKYIIEKTKSNTYLRHELSGVAPDLKSCGAYLHFHDYYTVNKVRLISANFCKKHLLCPLCAIRRASKLTSRYWDRFKMIQGHDEAIKPYFITLTLKNGEDLGECLARIKAAEKKMISKRREANKGRRSPIEMSKALAGVSAYEIKRGENSGLWHVHIHAVWLCKDKPWETKLSQEWREITGDSYIVDVREVTDVMGFIEVLSYAVKFSTMTLEDNLNAFLVLKGKRLVNSFGWFRGIEDPEKLTDDPLEDLPYHELIFNYVENIGYKLQPETERTQGLEPEYQPEEKEVPF